MSFLETLQAANRERKLRLFKTEPSNVVKLHMENHVALPVQEQAEPRSSTAVAIPITEEPVWSKDIADRLDALLEEVDALRARARAIEKDIGAARPAIARRLTTARAIILATAKYYNLPISELYSDRRHAAVIRAKHVAMYLAKSLTTHSLPEIGRRFGGRDHTTVLNAWDKIAEKRKVDADLNREIDELTTIILEAANVG